MLCFCCNCILSLHKDGFKVVGSLKMTCTLVCQKNSSEFLTEVRNIWNNNGDIFIDFETSVWILW